MLQLQKFPLTFELANLATTVGVRHGLVSLGAQQYYSGGCLVGDAIDAALAAPTKQLTVAYWQRVFGSTFQV